MPGSWTATGAIALGRAMPDGTVVIAGGRDSVGIGVAPAEVYDPRNGTWRSAGMMVTPRLGASASLLRGGAVLVAGGASTALQESAVASAELFGH